MYVCMYLLISEGYAILYILYAFAAGEELLYLGYTVL